MLKNKRGQFYLLAAIIIVVLIAGFSTINNYAQKKGIVKLYDVGDELNIESSKVLDYGVSSNQEELGGVIDDFTVSYNSYAGEDKEIYFIFGNQDSVSLITSEDVTTGEIYLTGVGGKIGAQITGEQLNKISYTPSCSGNVCLVSMIIGKDKYDFELKPGENFYFILSQVVGEEQLVVQG